MLRHDIPPCMKSRRPGRADVERLLAVDQRCPLVQGRSSFRQKVFDLSLAHRSSAATTETFMEDLVTYPNTQLFINGKWRPSQSGKTIAVLNPATEEQIGTVAHADRADLDEALEAAAKGFKAWRAVSPFERCRIMRKAAQIMRERNDEIEIGRASCRE